MGHQALLQGIFPTQGLNSHLPASPALQTDSLPTEHLRSQLTSIGSLTLKQRSLRSHSNSNGLHCQLKQFFQLGAEQQELFWKLRGETENVRDTFLLQLFPLNTIE